MAIHRARAAASLIICLAALGACRQPVDTTPSADAALAAEETKQLRQSIEFLTSRVEALDASARLKLGDSGFSLLHTNLGTLTVQWMSVAKVGAGSRLSLRIGNPLSGRVNKLTVSALIKDPDGALINKPKAMAFEFKGVAPEGAWSTMSMMVDGIPPDRIAEIVILSAEIGNIGLRE